MGDLSERVRQNNNEFWESVKEYYLNDFLTKAYKDSVKNKWIKKWLGKRPFKTILMRQVDRPNNRVLVSDFLLITCYPDRFEIRIVNMNENREADVEIEATHWGIVTRTDNLSSFLSGLMDKHIRLKKMWRSPRDHYWVARLFFS